MIPAYTLIVVVLGVLPPRLPLCGFGFPRPWPMIVPMLVHMSGYAIPTTPHLINLARFTHLMGIYNSNSMKETTNRAPQSEASQIAKTTQCFHGDGDARMDLEVFE